MGVMTKNFVSKYWWIVVPIGGYLFGRWIDRRVDDNMRDYHNKSALFGGRALAPGEKAW